MTPIKDCLINNKTDLIPIWLMRQAGRYLPEFREIRKNNPNFIELCLNSKLSKEITLQPIKRFDFDAAIIFSDILMIPYGLGQKVEFKKNFGPNLEDLEIDKLLEIDEEKFTKNLSTVYELLVDLKKSEDLKNKDLIGFVGAPWTLLVYMINKISPKNGLISNFFSDTSLINNLLKILDKFIKIHIKNQVKAGATIIQIFDSWSGLIESDFDKYLYNPTLSLVNYTKSLGVPVICFPRGIADYSQFCKIVEPSMINIDYDVDPENLLKNIDIPIQGGLHPEVLLTNKAQLKKEVNKYLGIFKDHPYVFNLGHGILPETKIEMVEELVKIVRDFK
ncbi:uroporphyrinogen decarboxylase [Pelagibacteraceae bacterium GOM-A1]|nr:uroporphyrinogen decarboxylase [Pelagibacteraceae bacterium GOM-A1]